MKEWRAAVFAVLMACGGAGQPSAEDCTPKLTRECQEAAVMAQQKCEEASRNCRTDDWEGCKKENAKCQSEVLEQQMACLSSSACEIDGQLQLQKSCWDCTQIECELLEQDYTDQCVLPCLDEPVLGLSYCQGQY